MQIGRPDDAPGFHRRPTRIRPILRTALDQWEAGMTKGKLVERLSKTEKTPGIEYNFSQYIQDNVDEALPA